MLPLLLILHYRAARRFLKGSRALRALEFSFGKLAALALQESGLCAARRLRNEKQGGSAEELLP